MNPEIPTPESFDAQSSERTERELRIDRVRERYLERAAAERGWLEVPEPYRGAHSQTRVHIKQIEALSEHAEEIFDFEQSLEGKTPEELQAEVERVQAEMDKQRKLQLDLRNMAHEHQVRVDDTGRAPDKEIISSLEGGEDKALKQQNLLFEFKQIVQARLQKEQKP